MNINKNHITQISAALVLFSFIGATHAAVDVASVSTKPADLVFAAETGPVTLDIVPETNLVAGNIIAGALLASVSIAPAQETDTVAIKYSDSVGVINGLANERRLSGTNDTNHKLDVLLHINANAWSFPEPPTSPGWLHAKTPGAMSLKITTDSYARYVAADTYFVSLDAGIWSE
ncbi:TPA: hypothetical protein ACKP36_004394 [Serratia marcescens]|uniref:hypothetical protein n=1 Tax=Serratia marcescens TaxID=615 RepID=UPI00301BFEC7